MRFVLTPQHIEHLEAMKQAGADAMLLNVAFFGARGASEVEVEELPAWCKKCQELGLELFVQLNRFFCEEELPKVEQFLANIKEYPIQGIVFGDEGVLQIAKELQMEDRLIYQPDTLLTNHLDVSFYLNQGIHSVVLAKEITLEEILQICEQCDASKLETIIHGRLSMMYSKRPLLSNYFNFIKKEVDVHGKRDYFVMEETRDMHMPIMEDEQGTHVFSGFTQQAFLQIKELEKSGIGYVRIDGIFHDDAYSIDALRMYQAILQGKLEPEVALAQFQETYPNDACSDGFYYTKTSKTK